MEDNNLIRLICTTLEAGLTGTAYDFPIAQGYQPTQQGVASGPNYYLYKVIDKPLGFPEKTDTWGNTEIAQFAGSITGSVLTVTSVEVGSGAIAPGQTITAIGLPFDTLILSTGTGTGGVGTYNLNISTTIAQQSMTSGASAMIHKEVSQYETTFQLSALSTQSPDTPDQKTASDLLNYARYVLQSQMSIATFEAQGVGILKIAPVSNTPFMDDRDQFEYSPSFDFVMTHKQTIVTTTPVLESEEIQILRV